MLATTLRVSLALELVVYAALAWSCFEITPLASVLIALAALLALRFVLTGVTFGYAYFYRSPSSRLGPLAATRMFLTEYAALVANFVLISPFERCWMGPDRLTAGDGRPPVLLIHGYCCSRAAWWCLRRRLEAAGWVVATINLEPFWASIETYVEAVSRRIDEVLAASGAKELIVVGHSMGGLVARAYLRRHGGAKVCRLVTLATPHTGSELARRAVGQNARQMRPGNAWLKTLGDEEALIDTVNIFSPHDNYVMPQANQELAGAPSWRIDGQGHLFMLFSRPAAALVLHALSSPALTTPVCRRGFKA